MLITGARVALNATTAYRMNVWISGGSVSFLPVPSLNEETLDLENFIIFPGLINAHDHLELNLFPRLGCGPYRNASAWARDIYRPLEPPVKQHLAVPKSMRLLWGAIKNLVSGVTTVAHHNTFASSFLDTAFPIRAIERFGWAHSLTFSSDWERRFRDTPPGYPFIIHAAEGTDETSRREIHMLEEAGALNRSTVLVHGVALGPAELPLLASRGVSIVWCPSSNHFTLGRSLNPAVLNSVIPIALGTDSALTADGDLLDELRVARRSVSSERLYSMVTSEAARILRLPPGYGRVCHRGPADLLIMRDNGQTPAEILVEHYPELVICRGRLVLASLEFAQTHQVEAFLSMQPLEVEGRGSYLLHEHISPLLAATKAALQEHPRLAGKALAA